MDEQVQKLKNYMDESGYTVAITGAGISYMYGMRRFKQLAGEGSWRGKMSAHYIKSHPDEIFELFKGAFLDAIFEKGPGPVHYQLAKLEEQGYIQGIVTQNLDYLHNLAGSKNVVAFMGSFADTVCLDCGAEYHDINVWKDVNELPRCEQCGGYLLPAYFYRMTRRFGAGKNEWMEQAKDMIAKADLLVVIGTTGFHSDEYLKKMRPDTKIVQINPGSTMFDEMAVLNIRMDAEKVFDEILTEG